tara:strand:+ start:6174 stop:6479 length:306 start_codon:yes stop_codon:yes gene_type:complete
MVVDELIFLLKILPEDIVDYIDCFRRIVCIKDYYSKILLSKLPNLKPQLYKTSYHQTVYIDQNYIFAKRIDKYKSSYDWFRKYKQPLNHLETNIINITYAD